MIRGLNVYVVLNVMSVFHVYRGCAHQRISNVYGVDVRSGEPIS
jgi:hypothetical protein